MPYRTKLEYPLHPGGVLKRIHEKLQGNLMIVEPHIHDGVELKLSTFLFVFVWQAVRKRFKLLTFNTDRDNAYVLGYHYSVLGYHYI